MSKVITIASHILVFLIRSVVNPFKFSLSNFATDGISASQMCPLLWKAISICEKSLLKVIANTCDCASPNRKLFRMHWDLTQDDDMNPGTDVTIVHVIYLVVPKIDSFTLFLMFRTC